MAPPPPPTNAGTVGETVPDPEQTETSQAEFAALIAAAASVGTTGTPPTTGDNKRKQNQISAKACYHHIHKGGCTIVNCPFDHSLPSGIVKCPNIATCKRGLSCIYSH